MYRKRGLIYLVILLLIPIVYSQSFPGNCEDGTNFGYCSPGTTLFCSTESLFLNSGFETDRNEDGIPDHFIIGTNNELNRDVFYSDDAFPPSRKSIKLTKQWASFDYVMPWTGVTFLSPDTEYIFSSFVKGSCNNYRVFYSNADRTPPAHYLCGSERPCTPTPYKYGWSRLVTQFNSNEIETVGLGVPYLYLLRVECADSTPFELYIDNMHLQSLDTPPELTENCQLCGSCSNGLFCAPDGSCVNEDELAEFLTEDELVVLCLEEENYNFCNQIPKSSPKRIVADSSYALHYTDRDKCPDELCEQSVILFDCIENGGENCIDESLSIYKTNPNFQDGESIRVIVWDSRWGTRFGRFGLENGGGVSGECRLRFADWEGEASDVRYNRGSIINHNFGNTLLGPSNRNQCSGDYCYVLNDLTPFNTGIHADCRMDKECNLIDHEAFFPEDAQIHSGETIILGSKLKADLLCGQDDTWYVCDRDGIKEFNDKRYLCNGDSGTWTEIIGGNIDSTPNPFE